MVRMDLVGLFLCCIIQEAEWSSSGAVRGGLLRCKVNQLFGKVGRAGEKVGKFELSELSLVYYCHVPRWNENLCVLYSQIIPHNQVIRVC